MLSYYDKILLGRSYARQLQSYHDEIKNKIEREKIIKQGKNAKNAKLIEDFLYNLKNFSKTEISNVNDPYFKLINLIKEKLSEYAKKDLFRNNKFLKQFMGADNVQEFEFATVLSALSEETTEKITDETIKKFLAGENLDKSKYTEYLKKTQQNNTDKGSRKDDRNSFKIIFDDFLDNRLSTNKITEEYANLLSKRIGTDRELTQKNNNKNLFSWGLQQKADINTGEIKLIGKLGIDEEIINVLSNSTFSLKNYSDFMHINVNSLYATVGGGGYYKSFITPLTYIINEKNAEDFLDNLHKASFSEEISNIINEHLNHLRFMYELGGVGQLNKDGQPDVVDYLFVNINDKDTVIVRSIPVLILKEMKKGKYDKIENKVVLKLNI